MADETASSIFDTKRHTTLHRVFLLVFIVGVALSAIFTIVEVCTACQCAYTLCLHLSPQFRWLSKDLPYLQKLKASYIIKAIIAGTLIVLAIAFGITMYWSNDVGGECSCSSHFGVVGIRLGCHDPTAGRGDQTLQSNDFDSFGAFVPSPYTHLLPEVPSC